MNSKQTIEAKVIDTNNRNRGLMPIEIEFIGGKPFDVIHDGKHYMHTGKDGIWMATGIETREMATSDDARIWVTLDGNVVLED